MSFFAKETEAYLHAHIPLTRAMGVSVSRGQGDAIVLTAPLEPNLNHKATAFGGSVSALAILSGWVLLHSRLTEEDLACELVIRSNQIDYITGARDIFSATASLETPDKWAASVKQLRRGRMARFRITAQVTSGQTTCALFSGEYVATPSPR